MLEDCDVLCSETRVCQECLDDVHVPCHSTVPLPPPLAFILDLLSSAEAGRPEIVLEGLAGQGVNEASWPTPPDHGALAESVFQLIRGSEGMLVEGQETWHPKLPDVTVECGFIDLQLPPGMEAMGDNMK